MTKEEREIALYCLKVSSDYHSEVCEECVKYPNCDHTIQDDVTETIIKALEQQPCEDCISRADAINLVHDLAQPCDDSLDWDISADEMIDGIKSLPSATPQQKIGKWITQWNVAHQKEYYCCSECREEFSYDGETGIKMSDYKYCPKCGAKMEIEGDDEEI